MELETQVIVLDLKYLDNAKAEHLANCTAEGKASAEWSAGIGFHPKNDSEPLKANARNLKLETRNWSYADLSQTTRRH